MFGFQEGGGVGLDLLDHAGEGLQLVGGDAVDQGVVLAKGQADQVVEHLAAGGRGRDEHAPFAAAAFAHQKAGFDQAFHTAAQLSFVVAGGGGQLVQRHRRPVADLGHHPPFEVRQPQDATGLRRGEAADGAQQPEQPGAVDPPVRRIDPFEPGLSLDHCFGQSGPLNGYNMHTTQAITKAPCDCVASWCRRPQCALAGVQPSPRPYWKVTNGNASISWILPPRTPNVSIVTMLSIMPEPSLLA